MTSVEQFGLALSPVTIPQCSFAEAFRVTAEAGFQGIGLRYNLLAEYLAAGHTIGDVRALARSHGLRFPEGAFLAEWQFDGGLPVVSKRKRDGGPDEARDVLLRNLKTFLEHCSELECESITASPSLYKTGDLSTAAEDFSRLCDFAKPYGLRIAFEFMGSAPQFRTVKSAFDLVAAADRPNGGVVIDTFLFHEGKSRVADIPLNAGPKIFNVQVADSKPKPHEQLNMLEDRLFPGEGVAPVRDVMERAAAAGYSGLWTVELFNPDYKTRPAADIAKKAFETTSAILRDIARNKASATA